MKPAPAGTRRRRAPGHLAAPLRIEEIRPLMRLGGGRNELGVDGDRIDEIIGGDPIGLRIGQFLRPGAREVRHPGEHQIVSLERRQRAGSIEDIGQNPATLRFVLDAQRDVGGIGPDIADLDAIFRLERIDERAHDLRNGLHRIPDDFLLLLGRRHECVVCGAGGRVAHQSETEPQGGGPADVAMRQSAHGLLLAVRTSARLLAPAMLARTQFLEKRRSLKPPT